MIQIFAREGLVQKTFKLFQLMKKAGHAPKGPTFYQLLLVWVPSSLFYLSRHVQTAGKRMLIMSNAASMCWKWCRTARWSQPFTFSISFFKLVPTLVIWRPPTRYSKVSEPNIFFWNSVILKTGWKPDCSSFCALIQGESTPEKIMEHWDKMLEMKIEPDLR